VLRFLLVTRVKTTRGSGEVDGRGVRPDSLRRTSDEDESRWVSFARAEDASAGDPSSPGALDRQVLATASTSTRQPFHRDCAIRVLSWQRRLTSPARIACRPKPVPELGQHANSASGVERPVALRRLAAAEHE